MRTEYYVEYPRGFANEYRLLAATTPRERADIQRNFPSAERITWKRAESLARRKPYDTAIPIRQGIIEETMFYLGFEDDALESPASDPAP